MLLRCCSLILETGSSGWGSADSCWGEQEVSLGGRSVGTLVGAFIGDGAAQDGKPEVHQLVSCEADPCRFLEGRN